MSEEVGEKFMFECAFHHDTRTTVLAAYRGLARGVAMKFNFVIVCDTYGIEKNNIGIFLLNVSIDQVPNVEEGPNVYLYKF